MPETEIIRYIYPLKEWICDISMKQIELKIFEYTINMMGLKLICIYIHSYIYTYVDTYNDF